MDELEMQSGNFKKIIYRPFDSKILKKRKVQGGKIFTYVPNPYIIDRLNEAFDFQWSFTILKSEITPSTSIREAWCQGRLTVEIGGKTVIKEAFGNKEIEKNATIGDCLKAAASDSLKKAASLLGVASHLYKK